MYQVNSSTKISNTSLYFIYQNNYFSDQYIWMKLICSTKFLNLLLSACIKHLTLSIYINCF